MTPGAMAVWQADHATVRFIDDVVIIDRFGPLWEPGQSAVPFAAVRQVSVRPGPAGISLVVLELTGPLYGSTSHIVGFTEQQRGHQQIVVDYLLQIAAINATAPASGSLPDTERAPAPLSPCPADGGRRAAAPPAGPATEHWPACATDPGTARRTGPVSFVAVDVETANADRGSICAIGIAVVRGGAVAETYSWLCRPPRPVRHFDALNIGIHHITAHDVRHQPKFADRMAELERIVADAPVVCHNADFDIDALMRACTYSRIPTPTWRFGCTLVWSRRHVTGLANYRLPTVSAHFDAEVTNHHDAASDAVAAAHIMLGLLRQAGAVDLDTFVDAGGGTYGTVTTGSMSSCRAAAAWRPGRGIPEYAFSCEIARDRRRRAGLLVRGRDVLWWQDKIGDLKRAGDNEQALALLLECITVAEHPQARMGGNPEPWFTEHAAIVYRKLHNPDGEHAILERWFNADPPIVLRPDVRGERVLRERLDRIAAKNPAHTRD